MMRKVAAAIAGLLVLSGGAQKSRGAFVTVRPSSTLAMIRGEGNNPDRYVTRNSSGDAINFRNDGPGFPGVTLFVTTSFLFDLSSIPAGSTITSATFTIGAAELTDFVSAFGVSAALFGKAGTELGTADIRRSVAGLPGDSVARASFPSRGITDPPPGPQDVDVTATVAAVAGRGENLVSAFVPGSIQYRIGIQALSLRVEYEAAPVTVPEPASVAMLMVGLGGVAAMTWRRRVA